MHHVVGVDQAFSGEPQDSVVPHESAVVLDRDDPSGNLFGAQNDSGEATVATWGLVLDLRRGHGGIGLQQQ